MTNRKKDHPYYTVLARGFRCCYCDAPPEEVKVIDSRATLKMGLVMKRRTRLCKVCERRYSTYEVNPEDFKKLVRGQKFLTSLADTLKDEFL